MLYKTYKWLSNWLIRWQSDWGVSAACLEMSACTTCTPPGLRLRFPWNPEEESPTGNPNTGLPLQTRRRSHQLCHLPGKECLHCLHSFPAGGLTLPAWEWAPQWHADGVTNCFLPGKDHLHCLHSFPAWGVSTACPGKECLTCLHSFQTGGLALPAWEWVPALLPS